MLRWCSAALAAAFLAGLVAAGQTLPSFDVVIRNGRVLDGSGNPWIRADIAIRADRIVRVGRVEERGSREIDAGDRFVTPGFIDVHSHAADGLARGPLRQARPLIAQGITTVLVNPDGGGPIDLATQRAAFERGGTGPNVGLLIGHGSVRRAVVADSPRPATGGEIDQMRALVRAAMQDGALGLSSGLFYTPGSYASTEELIALAAVAGEHGGVYASHIRDEGDYGIGLLAAVDEAIRIADEARTIGIVTHMKALGRASRGRAAQATARIDAARARGVQVFADQYPYEASSTSLRAALLPGGVPATEPVVRENLARRGGAGAIQIAFYREDPSLEGRTLAAIAAARKASPEETAMELMATGNPSIVSFNMAEDDIRHIMTRPYTMASSDGGLVPPDEGTPHPRDYGAFARRLAVYVRDRQVVGLEFAVRSMTSLPALVFSLADRGVIREGAFADLAVFDLARVRDTATYERPHQLAEGMSWVLVNGIVVVEDGAFTDALPGRVLRRGTGGSVQQ